MLVPRIPAYLGRTPAIKILDKDSDTDSGHQNDDLVQQVED